MSVERKRRLRPYAAADRQACLDLFASNTPQFFEAHEQPEFAAFLDRLPCPFFVVEDGGEIVGCGGYAPERGRLVWGMIGSGLHRQGLGRFLLLARLDHWYRQHGPSRVTLSTSQHSHGFFLREGFVVTEVTPDGFAPGLDRYDVELTLDDERHREIARRLGEPC
jgi:hypothetical protein